MAARAALRAAGAPGPGGRHRRRRRRGREALLPPDPPGGEQRRATQPPEALLGGVPRGLLLQAPASDWELLEQLPRGADRHHRVPGRRRAAGAAAGRRRARRERKAARLQDIFGRDNLFVELQDHGLADQRTHQPAARRDRPAGSARRCSRPTTATTRTGRTPWPTTRCCACRPGACIDDPNRFRFEGTEHYLKSAAEMRHLFREVARGVRQHPADRRAGRRRDRARAGRACPSSRYPSGSPATPTRSGRWRYLRDLTTRGAGALRRGPAGRGGASGSTTSSGSSATMGFSAYFLVVWDLIRFARESGIRVGPGRGSRRRVLRGLLPRASSTSTRSATTCCSSASSTPAASRCPTSTWTSTSATGATMIRYAAERYGDDHVAQIVTFSTIKARAAVRDAARVLGLPLQRGRPDRQGDAAAGHGPRHAAVRPASRKTPGTRTDTRRRRRAARRMYATRTPTPSGSSTWPRASRACAARTASTPPPWSSPTTR